MNSLENRLKTLKDKELEYSTQMTDFNKHKLNQEVQKIFTELKKQKKQNITNKQELALKKLGWNRNKLYKQKEKLNFVFEHTIEKILRFYSQGMLKLSKCYECNEQIAFIRVKESKLNFCLDCCTIYFTVRQLENSYDALTPRSENLEFWVQFKHKFHGQLDEKAYFNKHVLRQYIF